MAVKVGLSGFGRIGRYLTRLMIDVPELELGCINARASNEDLALLLKHDSVHGILDAEVEAYEDGIVINGNKVPVTRNAPDAWDWGKRGCELVVETTGKFGDPPSAQKFKESGAKKILISAPGKKPEITVVMGVNDDQLTPEHTVISNASCTTNCLAPVAKVINDEFSIKHGIMTTVHAYTMSQRNLDGSHKDIRRARACAMNMIPTTTGAARAVAKVLPEMEGKLDGMAIRVPTPNVSLVDLVCEVEKPTTAEEVNAALKAAANEHLGYSEQPLVSTDYVGSTFGGVVDSLSTRVMGGTQVKLIVWYDNEAGFSNQLLRLTKKVAGMM